MYQKLIDREATLAVIGLGYVGLPLALAFAKVGIKVIGFDINDERLEMIRKGIDPSHELSQEDIESANVMLYTSDDEDLRTANFFIIAVPTPVTQSNQPDLHPLLSASETVGQALKIGDYVVYESTTYPGCTEEDCLPTLLRESHLILNDDFKLGYSPERINPGDRNHTLSSVVKVVSGSDDSALENISQIYSLIVRAGVHRAQSIRVAEASKIVENTQRDLNISLMNELSLIFDRMGINTFDVLDAAKTKWNFLRFEPGLVGGHCIGIDPYYLTHKASKLGFESKVIASSRHINDDMAKHVARKIIKQVFKISDSPRVLVKGVTFKENVADIRNSKIIDTVKELLDFGITVDVEDPFANPTEVKLEYGLNLISAKATTKFLGYTYDAIIVTLPHAQYLDLDREYFNFLLRDDGILADLKGIYRNKFEWKNYWSL